MALQQPLARRDVIPALVAASISALFDARSAARRLVIEAPAGAGRSWILDGLSSSLPLPVHRATNVDASIARPFALVDDLLGGSHERPLPVDFSSIAVSRFEDLTAGGPVALVIDNLQWSDAESLDVLSRVTAEDAVTAVVLIAASRSDSEREVVRDFIGAPETDIWKLPGFDRVDLDVLVHDRMSFWPGERLRGLLSQISANALHLTTVLDGLVASNSVVVCHGELELVGSGDASTTRTFDALTEEKLATLAGTELDLVRVLAAWGSSAPPSTLASILSVPIGSLTPTIRRLLDNGLLVTGAKHIAFAQDAWRDAIYEATPGLIRSALHRAAAEHSAGLVKVRHLAAFDQDGDAVLSAMNDADAEVGTSPHVAAELLDEAAGHVRPGTPVAARLAVSRARALARTGQMDRAVAVAEAASSWTHEIDVHSELRRIRIFTLGTRGRFDEAIELVDETLSFPVAEKTRRMLSDHRNFLDLLAGTTPVPLLPYSDNVEELSLNGLIAEGVRRMLLGDTGVALEFVWSASHRAMSEGFDPYEGSSADIWPPHVEMMHRGPLAAREALVEVVRLREKRGALWQTSGHEVMSALIAMRTGMLDDAAAQYDSALEIAQRFGLAWLSQAVSERALLDVLRGQTRGAEARISSWLGDSRPRQFGISGIDRARSIILEAQRHYGQAAALATSVWADAGRLHLYRWQAVVAPEFARIALRAADEGFCQAIHKGLLDAPRFDGVDSPVTSQLALAMTGDDYLRVPEKAQWVADQALKQGDQLTRLAALEEGAIALAVSGDRDAARERAREAISLAGEIGAVGVSTRIVGRMRTAGVRLGSTSTRSRATHGWDSLTPTEQRVVDLVSSGSTGPEIAEQLYVSPRTVQTHVSHVLAKLGLTNRMELAAAAASRG